MKNIQNLLDQIQLLRKKNTEILDATGARFNIFRICGVNHYENTHSAIIKEFLDPNGSHGLKDDLLKIFIDCFGNENLKHIFNTKKAKVTAEYPTSEGRLDILIHDTTGNNAIIIENKIEAKDQWQQLIRYNRYASSNFKNHQLFYLSLNGNEASEQSSTGVNYHCLSYSKDIIFWLEKCIGIVAKFPLVRETIIQYINHLKSLTDQDMDAKNREELINLIISNPSNISNAVQIASVLDDCKFQIIQNLKEPLQHIADKYNLEVIFDDNFGKKETGIWLKKEHWNYCILFWFSRNYELNVGIDTWKNFQGDETYLHTLEELKRFMHNFVIDKKVDHNWIWGDVFQPWDDCTWEDVLIEIPAEIEKYVEVLIKKINEFESSK